VGGELSPILLSHVANRLVMGVERDLKLDFPKRALVTDIQHEQNRQLATKRSQPLGSGGKSDPLRGTSTASLKWTTKGIRRGKNHIMPFDVAHLSRIRRCSYHDKLAKRLGSQNSQFLREAGDLGAISVNEPRGSRWGDWACLYKQLEQ